MAYAKRHPRANVEYVTDLVLTDNEYAALREALDAVLGTGAHSRSRLPIWFSGSTCVALTDICEALKKA